MLIYIQYYHSDTNFFAITFLIIAIIGIAAIINCNYQSDAIT
jgi:hypothetical protein